MLAAFSSISHFYSLSKSKGDLKSISRQSSHSQMLLATPSARVLWYIGSVRECLDDQGARSREYYNKMEEKCPTSL